MNEKKKEQLRKEMTELVEKANQVQNKFDEQIKKVSEIDEKQINLRNSIRKDDISVSFSDNTEAFWASDLITIDYRNIDNELFDSEISFRNSSGGKNSGKEMEAIDFLISSYQAAKKIMQDFKDNPFYKNIVKENRYLQKQYDVKSESLREIEKEEKKAFIDKKMESINELSPLYDEQTAKKTVEILYQEAKEKSMSRLNLIILTPINEDKVKIQELNIKAETGASNRVDFYTSNDGYRNYSRIKRSEIENLLTFYRKPCDFIKVLQDYHEETKTRRTNTSEITFKELKTVTDTIQKNKDMKLLMNELENKGEILKTGAKLKP